MIALGVVIATAGGCTVWPDAWFGCEAFEVETCLSGSAGLCRPCVLPETGANELHPNAVYIVTDAQSLPDVAWTDSADGWAELQAVQEGVLPHIDFDGENVGVIVRQPDHTEPCTQYGWLDGLWAVGDQLVVHSGFYRLSKVACTPEFHTGVALALVVEVSVSAAQLSVCNMDVDERITGRPDQELLDRRGEECPGSTIVGYEVPPPPADGGFLASH